jgi:tRNA nucleotidyltransferase (CCA-adding enzyme)
MLTLHTFIEKRGQYFNFQWGKCRFKEKQKIDTEFLKRFLKEIEVYI